MSETELWYLARAASRSSEICEIGSWLGRSSCALAENTSGSLLCVDTWLGTEEQGEHGKDILPDFLSNLSHMKNVGTMQSCSLDAAARLSAEGRSFDLIFIDAKHDYESISADIRAWKRLLRTGGVMCGHDFHAHWPGVMKAVREEFEHFRIVDTIWTTEPL